MNTNFWKISVAAAVLGGLAWSMPGAWAQTNPVTPAAAPVVTPAPTLAAPVPQLSYSVQQVLKLQQANVSEDTIVAYINNAGNSYGLDADVIIYLRQQGVSTAVITAMLGQGRAGLTMPAPATPAPAPVLASAPAPQSEVSTVSQPASTVTYIGSAPSPAYYYPAYSSPYYYSPYYNYPYYGYGWYAPVGVSIGFGWGGGWHGGWHGGGGFHGGHH